MSEHGRSDDDLPISDDVARRILAAAAEIEERREGTQITIGQLREAAREAGISREAFDSALALVHRTDAPRSAPAMLAPMIDWKSRIRSLFAWSGTVGGAIGLTWGVLQRAGIGPLASAPALGAAIGASVYLALRFRPSSRLGDFLVGDTLLWVYLVAGFIVGSGTSITWPAVSLLGPLVVSCLMIGAAIIKGPRLSDDDTDDVEVGTPR